ncbi:MAG: EAL domain-containing protein [Gammaproteobacteria bacterium]|jgi:diguanylate cyclase (GGDEF)-like protein/PAS domain S-box-containing protein|nr:EAL domain-containing protein [Gammaproteobacteria bacterium]
MDENEQAAFLRAASTPEPDLEDLEYRCQRTRQGPASSRLAEGEAAFATSEQGARTLIDALRIQQAELKSQNEDLRSTRQALEETLNRFSAVFQALPVAVLNLDASGMIREANRAAAALLNLPGRDDPHAFLIPLVGEAHRDALSRALHESAERQPVTLAEITLYPLASEPLIVDLHLAALPGEAGSEPELICTVIDRSESVQQRRLLQEQQAQLEAIFQAAPVGIVFVRARRMLQFNAAWAELVGYTPEELDRQDTRLLYADDQEYTRVGQELYAQVNREGTGRVQTRFRHKTGHPIDVALCASRVDQGDDSGAAVVTILDVTERKAAERALQEREERLRLTVAATNDGLWDLDAVSGRMTINERYGAMLGYAPGELDLRLDAVIALVHPDDRSAVRSRFEQHLHDDTPYALDIRMRCKDGGWRWLHTRGQVVARNAIGQPLRVVGTHTDIHARKLAEQALYESNARLREAERLAALGRWELFIESSELIWSHELYRIVGLDPAEPLPELNALARLCHPDDAGELLQRFNRALETGGPDHFMLRIFRRDGELRWLFIEGRTERDETGRLQRCFGTAQDVTEREQTRERLREAAKVFESTADGIVITNGDHQITAVNPAFTEITGYAEGAVCGQPLETVLASATDPAFWDQSQSPLGADVRWPGERWERRQDGARYRARLSVTAIRSERGQLDRYLVVLSDTTPLHRTQQQVAFLSQYDPLTGLVNRRAFQARLDQLLLKVDQGASRAAILIVDLDRFRVVNESLGPATADELLKQVAGALSQLVRPTDTLARLGSDEFGLILPAIGTREAIATVVNALQQRCAERRLVGGQSVTITASVGIARYPQDGASSDVLMRHANVALKQAKARGRQRVQHFEHPRAQGAPDRLQLEASLSQALAQNELQLHYQPQIQLCDGRLIGAEALLRWHSAELGPIGPQQFIPIAEDMGLIREIGDWVLRQAAQQLTAWDQAGQRLPRVAVNLSILQLEDEDLVDRIAGLLEEYQLAPERLELELTESLLMQQAGQSVATLDALRRLGVRLAIDDFGTGYSSLAYLHRLPLHQLKLDRSFVDPLPGDPHSQAIAQAVIALGDSLNLEVLAEGVETAEQAAWLRDTGCTLAQGYRYSRPLAPDAFAAQWLKHRDADTV